MQVTQQEVTTGKLLWRVNIGCCQTGASKIRWRTKAAWQFHIRRKTKDGNGGFSCKDHYHKAVTCSYCASCWNCRSAANLSDPLYCNWQKVCPATLQVSSGPWPTTRWIRWDKSRGIMKGSFRCAMLVIMIALQRLIFMVSSFFFFTVQNTKHYHSCSGKFQSSKRNSFSSEKKNRENIYTKSAR